MHQIGFSIFLLIAIMAAAANDSPDFAALKFDWKPGLKAVIDYEITKSRKSGNTLNDTRMKMKSELAIEAHPQGLQINEKIIEYAIDGDKGSSVEQEFSLKLMNKLAQFTPSYIVSPTGQLLSITQLNVMKEVLRHELNEVFKESPPDIQQQLNYVFDKLLTEEMFFAQIQADWKLRISQWLGAQLEKGRAYENSAAIPVAMLGNIEIPVTVVFLYLGRVPCTAKDTGLGCVELEMKSSLDAEGMTAAISRFFTMMGQTMPENFAFKIDEKVTLVTEPQTLRPHQITTIKMTRTPVGGQYSTIEEIETKKEIYTYQ